MSNLRSIDLLVIVQPRSKDISTDNGTTNSDLLGGYSLKWLAPIGSEHS